MSIRQLYQLQMLEQEIAAKERTLAQADGRLGESLALKQAKANLATAKTELEAAAREQRDTEAAIADLSAKAFPRDPGPRPLSNALKI